MGPTCCAEMSETNSQFMLRNISEDVRSQLLGLFSKRVWLKMTQTCKNLISHVWQFVNFRNPSTDVTVLLLFVAWMLQFIVYTFACELKCYLSIGVVRVACFVNFGMLLTISYSKDWVLPIPMRTWMFVSCAYFVLWAGHSFGECYWVCVCVCVCVSNCMCSKILKNEAVCARFGLLRH